MVSRGNNIFTGHADSLIKVRSLYTLESYEVYAGHLDWVMALCFDEAFNLYSAGYDGTIKKWNFVSRRVAFSFENKNGSVSSLAVYENHLIVGLKSGRIDCYNTDNSMISASMRNHSKTVSSLIVLNESIFSSGFDGRVLKFSFVGDGNFTTVFKSNREPIKDLSFGSSVWITLQGDNKIVLIPMNSNSGSVKVIDLQTPLFCVAATESVIIAGSRSGTIYAWGLETLKLEVELKGHVSPVNDLLVLDEIMFSASDDKTIIEWSLEMKTARKTFQRLSALALGHLGPVNSLSYCSETLFSAGSDLTVRRWNTETGKHADAYFGFTKPVTHVLCCNGSVFAGSEDFSVFMFKPNLPLSVKTKNLERTSTNIRRELRTKMAVRLNNSDSAVPEKFVFMGGIFAAVILVGIGLVAVFYWTLHV